MVWEVKLALTFLVITLVCIPIGINAMEKERRAVDRVAVMVFCVAGSGFLASLLLAMWRRL